MNVLPYKTTNYIWLDCAKQTYYQLSLKSLVHTRNKKSLEESRDMILGLIYSLT